MKKKILSCSMALFAGALLAAGSSLKDDVTSAAQKLNDIGNYTWHATVIATGDSQFKFVSTDGETEKHGITYVQLAFDGNTAEFATKGGTTAITDQNHNWLALASLDTNLAPNRLTLSLARNFKNPDVQAVELAAAVTEFKGDNGACTGSLTEDTARALLDLHSGDNGNAVTVSNLSGSVTFWITAGALAKYEVTVSGTVSADGSNHDVERDTTVDIKYVNTTRVAIPNEARKLLPGSVTNPYP